MNAQEILLRRIELLKRLGYGTDAELSAYISRLVGQVSQSKNCMVCAECGSHQLPCWCVGQPFMSCQTCHAPCTGMYLIPFTCPHVSWVKWMDEYHIQIELDLTRSLDGVRSNILAIYDKLIEIEFKKENSDYEF